MECVMREREREARSGGRIEAEKVADTKMEGWVFASENHKVPTSQSQTAWDERAVGGNGGHWASERQPLQSPI